jgi:carbamoylphosphate synthase small subunit
MNENNVPGLYGIDTRKLTKKLRKKGTQLGKIIYDNEKIHFEDPNKRNLVSEVSIKKPITYKKGKKKVEAACKSINLISTEEKERDDRFSFGHIGVSECLGRLLKRPP